MSKKVIICMVVFHVIVALATAIAWGKIWGLSIKETLLSLIGIGPKD